MFDIKQIESFYPENQRAFKKNLLREYLQYKILEIIFNSGFGEKLAFMGGTAARIIHSNNRFSEDLDFDNLGMNEDEFSKLSEIIRYRLLLEGYSSEINNVFKGAFRSYLKILDVLYENKISNHKEEKLIIQIDAEPQNFYYKIVKIIINKFDVFMRINAVPPDLLLAQKVFALINRKRPLGRDFYDVIFFLGKVKPNFDYLTSKLKIKNSNDLQDILLAKCRELDLLQLAKDIESFVINPEDAKKILLFEDYIRNIDFV